MKARERAGRWYKDHPNAHRRRNGLPEPLWQSPETCECCGRPARNLKRVLALDHNHINGKFRGWLCGWCNRGIGFLGDNIQGVHCALLYLQRAELI